MKKLVSAQVLAAVSLTVAFPLVASANSASLEEAYERIHQPLNTQSSDVRQSNEVNEFALKADVYSGESHAMNAARQRITEGKPSSKSVESQEASESLVDSRSENMPHGRDW